MQKKKNPELTVNPNNIKPEKWLGGNLRLLHTVNGEHLLTGDQVKAEAKILFDQKYSVYQFRLDYNKHIIYRSKQPNEVRGYRLGQAKQTVRVKPNDELLSHRTPYYAQILAEKGRLARF